MTPIWKRAWIGSAEKTRNVEFCCLSCATHPNIWDNPSLMPVLRASLLHGLRVCRRSSLRKNSPQGRFCRPFTTRGHHLLVSPSHRAGLTSPLPSCTTLLPAPFDDATFALGLLPDIKFRAAVLSPFYL